MALSRRGFITAAGFTLAPSFAQEAPARLRRKDSFFGLHFDLHPSKSDTALGRDLTEEMVERLLARVRPDFVQYDCKGHAGYLGFPSKTGTSSPGIVKDSLEIWRRVTASRGIALYIHFSGVWDSLAVSLHSEWSRVRPDGKPDDRLTSTFGPYVDKLMIPELEEAIAKYSLDGAWIDGECWAVAPDYGDRARKTFAERTGDELPKKPEDANWLAFLEYNREQFRRYVRHYLDELHRLHPGVQIASNWLYSSYVPERPEIPVDYLSGDFLGPAPVSSARLEARYLASTGKPWDLMAWGFVADGGVHVHKRAPQLKQEAAAVITQGGGFQIYYNPTRAGWIDKRLVDVMAEVSEFCRERRALCFQTQPVPQIGVLFSGHSLYTNSNRLFGGWGPAINPARGTINALLAAHYSVEIVPDWRLGDAAAYPVIVVPDWPDIGAAARESLLNYARKGGALVLFGAENAIEFARAAGLIVNGAGEEEWMVAGDTGLAAIKGLWADIDAGEAELLQQRFRTFDTRKDSAPGALLANTGAGKVVMIPGPVGAAYASHHAPEIHEFLRWIIGRVFQPMVEIVGPSTIEVAIRKKGGDLLIHLTNMTGMQVGAEFPVTDRVPAVGGIGVAVRLPDRTDQVTWEPGGHRLDGSWENGVFRTVVESVEVHGAIRIG